MANNINSIIPNSKYENSITAAGEEFIHFICTRGGQNLLSGKNSYALPYTKPSVNKTWTCNIFHNFKKITTGDDLAIALIDWFNKYAEMYGLDANVIAAQAYIESNYVMWNYAGGSSLQGQDSTASGVNQFTMLTIYDIIIKGTYETIKMTANEITTLTNGMNNPLDINSYSVKSATYEDAWFNRPILHQNVIDNPDIMIKAQCRYMKALANRCASLTSSSLFCYSRGNFYADTYTNTIQKCKQHFVNNDKYLQEGLDYVLKIFGVLGDKNNALIKKGGYKPAGYYFGYDDTKGNSEKNLKLNQNFDSYNANVKESGMYKI